MMPVINISNGTIEEVFTEQHTTFVTVTYTQGQVNRRNEQTVRLVVGPRTVIVNSNGLPVPVNALRPGMTIDATISSAMTRSIPPQANAFVIRITGRPQQDSFTTGTILDIDRRGRSFTTISGRDASSVIRFNVPENVRVFNRFGRPVEFASLSPGMRVRVRHANFMTASIPPQTTAFEIRII